MSSYKKISVYVFLLILLAVTLGCAVFVDRFHEVGGEILADSNLEKGFSRWQVSGETSAVKIGNNILKIALDENDNKVRVGQIVEGLGDSGYLKLTGEVKTSGVIPGKKPWYRPRLVLSRYDEDGKWLSLPHTVFMLDGTNDWQTYEGVFRLVDGVARTEVVVQMMNATGEMWLRNLSLKKVAPSGSYRLAGILLMIAWGVGVLFLFRPYVAGRQSLWQKFMLSTVVLLIIVGTQLPASCKVRWQGGLRQAVVAEEVLVNNLVVSTVHGINGGDKIYIFGRLEIGKVGHALFFGILFALMLGALPSQPLLSMVADGAIFAAATEIMQNFAVGRSALFQDFLIDFSGCLIAWLIYCIIARVK